MPASHVRSRQVMRSLGMNPTNKEIADLIAEVDRNGNEKNLLIGRENEHRTPCLLGNQRLDFQEFVTFMSKHWHERDQEAELREAFRLFDRDNSGYITINELKQVRGSSMASFVSMRSSSLLAGHAEHGREIESRGTGRHDERGKDHWARTPSRYTRFRLTSTGMANSTIKVIELKRQRASSDRFSSRRRIRAKAPVQFVDRCTATLRLTVLFSSTHLFISV